MGGRGKTPNLSHKNQHFNALQNLKFHSIILIAIITLMMMIIIIRGQSEGPDSSHLHGKRLLA